MVKRAKRRPAHFLRAWRQERQLTLEQLADLADTDHSTLSRIENGRRQLNEKYVVVLAVALRIRPGDLFRSPDDSLGVWALAECIAALTAEQREMVARVVAALPSKGQSTRDRDAAK